jgi:O-6-methylguanine DNA methyltransferase
VPCDLSELAGFTRAVLRITARIPYGQVRSYRWIAERLGRPKASRAVGNALARNPVPIIIPCHRVTRSDGALGGYALGLGWKIRLLKLERNSVAR